MKFTSSLLTRLQALITSFVLLFSSFFGCGGDSGGNSDNESGPVLRFAVASDVHVTANDNQPVERLKALFDTAYEYSGSSKSYKKLDAVLFAGDFSDDGSTVTMKRFFETASSCTRKGTFVRAVLGNHEFYTDSSNTVARFLKESGYDSDDAAFKINGYYFIMISPDKDGRGFSESKQKWLDAKLSEAAASDPSGTKPIFVFQHHHVSGTVYGSGRWGVGDLRSVLNKYPQVVDFSGHSHFPINDPRSIWQGEFTALGDGTLAFYEMGLLGVAEHDIYPTDNKGGYNESGSISLDAAQYLIVEVDANNSIQVIGYDLLSDQIIVRYTIPSVGECSKFIYTNARADESSAPSFDNNASVTIINHTDSALKVSVPQASCDSQVQSYRFELYSKDGKLIETKYRLSDCFYFPTPERIECSFSDVSLSSGFTVKCYAVSCWGKESAPITSSSL